MERIEEEIFNKTMELLVDDPYSSSISILETAREIGKIEEKVNKFLTSGPRKKCEVSFTISDVIDKNSRTLFIVDMNGESNGAKKLSIQIRAIFQVKLSVREGFAKEVFSEYYIKKIMPQSRAISKTRTAVIGKKLLDAVRDAIPA